MSSRWEAMGDAWEDEGYAGEDDWGDESVEADLEEELLEPDEFEPEDDAAEPGARAENG